MEHTALLILLKVINVSRQPHVEISWNYFWFLTFKKEAVRAQVHRVQRAMQLELSADDWLVCNSSSHSINEALLACRCVWHLTCFACFCFFFSILGIDRLSLQAQCSIEQNSGVKCDISCNVDLPATQFESKPELFVVDDCVPSHVLLCPNTVWQSFLQSVETETQKMYRRKKKTFHSKVIKQWTLVCAALCLSSCIITADLWKKPTASRSSLARVRSKAWK